jgi:predicted RNase H-like HicB family nuclease
MEKETVHLPLIIETDEDGVFIVSCPSFKGCHSYGSTVEEAIANIREVVTICMEEQQSEPLNRFVGFRELEMPAARPAA